MGSITQVGSGLPAVLESGVRAARWIFSGLLVLTPLSALLSYGQLGGGAEDLGQVVQGCYGALVGILVMWTRSRWLVPLVAVALALGALNGGSGLEAPLIVITMLLVTVRHPAGVVVAVYVLLGIVFPAWPAAVWADARMPFHEHYLGWATLALIGLLIGLALREVSARGRARRLRLDHLAADNARVRGAERAALADELQELVTGRVRGIRALVDGHRGADPAAVSTVLTSVRESTRATLTELRTLLGLLREDEDAVLPVAGRGGEAELWATDRVLRVVAVTSLLLAGALALVDVSFDLRAGRVSVVVPVVAVAAFAVALRWPVAGWGMSAVVLVVMAFTADPDGWFLLAGAVMVVVAFARDRAWLYAATVLAVASFALVRSELVVVDALMVTLIVLGLTLPLGLVLRGVERARAAADVEEESLQVERAAIRATERSGVARELHDVVAHQLSLTAMSVMAAEVSDDPAVAAATLERVREHAAAAEAELAALLHTLRGEVEQGATDPWTSVPGRVGHLRKHLQDSGFEVEVEVDAHAADALDPLTRRTVIRVLQEGTTNAVRYAPSRSRVTLSVEVTPEGVVVGVASALASERGRSTLSLGYGLRGLAERVDLTGGEFSAGPVGDQWQVRAVLPVVAEVSASPAPAPRPAPAR